MASSPRTSLRRTLRALTFALTIPPGVGALAVHQSLADPARRDRIRQRWLSGWSRLILRVFAVELVVSGEAPPLPEGRGRLVVSNHRSAIDIGLLFALFAPRLVSRADLAGWPILGWGARRIGTLFVDRSSVHSGAAVLRHMRGALAAGDTVGLFPEGTTFPDDLVRPFRSASFAAARAVGAEVLPVGIAYASGAEASFGDESFLSHLGRIAGAEKTRVAVVIGAPLAASRAVDGNAFAAQVHAAVQRLVNEARALVDG